jgi:hypothetical protein
MNAGPTALDGLPDFLHLMTMAIAPMKTTKTTNADRVMMTMVLRFILWFLFTKLAVMGRSLVLPLGPLPV